METSLAQQVPSSYAGRGRCTIGTRQEIGLALLVMLLALLAILPAGPAAIPPGDTGTETQGMDLAALSGAHRILLGLPIELNTAAAGDLQAIPGIGPALSKRITDYRLLQGGFSRWQDLTEVKGIGPKRLALMRPYLSLPVSKEP